MHGINERKMNQNWENGGVQFQEQFQDNIDKGVFKHLSGEELKAYEGPVNYISMLEAYKMGPNATTPLRVCMNSSMKQPQPCGLATTTVS
jgi:hypothetical protein